MELAQDCVLQWAVFEPLSYAVKVNDNCLIVHLC
jgi:hypothetical protein